MTGYQCVEPAAKCALFMPPRNNSDPDEARYVENCDLATRPWLTSVWNRGVTPIVEMEPYAIPTSPSYGSSWKSDEREVATPTACEVAVKPPKVTASV